MASTGLCKETFLKAKKLLVLKGLINYHPGGGRKITNRYTFPLEDGTEEEKRRLFAYLKAPKTGRKSDHFNPTKTGLKSDQLSTHKQVGNPTTLQAKSDQKTGLKSDHEQEVSQKKQQQNSTVATTSFSPSHNQKKQVKDLVKSLVTLGIARKKSEDLIVEYGLDNVQKQYTWLFLRNITYPAGAFIASLKEDWPQPVKIHLEAKIPDGTGPERESIEYKKQYRRLIEASKERGQLDMERRRKGRKGKIGKKLNPYSRGDPSPYFADQVPDEICKDCPLQYDTHRLEHKTHGRLICLRRDVRAGLVGVLFSDSKEKTGRKLDQLEENGIPKRRAQPAIP